MTPDRSRQEQTQMSLSGERRALKEQKDKISLRLTAPDT